MKQENRMAAGIQIGVQARDEGKSMVLYGGSAVI